MITLDRQDKNLELIINILHTLTFSLGLLVGFLFRGVLQ